MLIILILLTFQFLSSSSSSSSTLSVKYIVQSSNTIIISGSHLCDSFKDLLSDYIEVISIDSHFETYENCRSEYSDYINNIYYNDNDKILLNTLKNINNQVIIALNRYDDNITSSNIDVINELNAIAMHHIKNHVIMIDNIRNLNSNMTLFDIMNTIMKINTQYTFTLDKDVIIAYINTPKPILQQYGYNVHSQNGEDGIIDRIYSIIGTDTKIAVEFGAWDGFHLSNTANLWSKENGWKGILIEADEDRFKKLKNIEASYNCHAIFDTVGTGINSLEEILKRNNETVDKIDLLSIDIDSDDYYVFESLASLKSRIIVVEYNPTIPAALDVYQEFGAYMGASVGALNRIAVQKNMTLVAITATNAIFVLNEYIPLLEKEYDFEITRMRNDDQLQYFITDFSGNHAIISGKQFNDPYQTKDSIIKNLKHGENTRITTELKNRLVEIVLSEDYIAGTTVTSQATGIVNNPMVEFSVHTDLKAGTKVFVKI